MLAVLLAMLRGAAADLYTTVGSVEASCSVTVPVISGGGGGTGSLTIIWVDYFFTPAALSIPIPVPYDSSVTVPPCEILTFTFAVANAIVSGPHAVVLKETVTTPPFATTYDSFETVQCTETAFVTTAAPATTTKAGATTAVTTTKAGATPVPTPTTSKAPTPPPTSKAPTPPPTTTAAPSDNTTLFIVIGVIALLLCCCCAVCVCIIVFFLMQRKQKSGGGGGGLGGILAEFEGDAAYLDAVVHAPAIALGARASAIRQRIAAAPRMRALDASDDGAPLVV